MATYLGPKVQGRKGGALAAAVGVAAVISFTPSAVLAEKFLIPSIIAPADPPPPRLGILSSKTTHPIPRIAPLIRVDSEIVSLTTEARERYHRLADELVAIGMPSYLKPHKFAVRCLVAAAPESEIDAAAILT